MPFERGDVIRFNHMIGFVVDTQDRDYVGIYFKEYNGVVKLSLEVAYVRAKISLITSEFRYEAD
jgi:hypothetical protein